MKKYFLIIFAAITLTGCLSEDPKGQVRDEDAYTSAADVEHNLVANLYNYIGGKSNSQGLQGTTRGVYDFNSMTTDEQILPVRGGDWYDGGFWQRLYFHKWTATETPLFDTWNYLYKVVMLCNQSIEKIDEHKSLLSTSEHAALLSEVRAIRALFYWELMDMYGRVPLVTKTNSKVSEVTQSERSEVYHFIIDELQQSLPYLSQERSNWQGSYYGRITRPVAQFLLAKLALNAEIYSDDNWTDESYPSGKEIFFEVNGKKLNAWQTVIAYCDELAAEGYQLEENAAFNFSINNETSKENIFVIPMDKVLYANQYGYLFRSRHYSHGSALGLDSENGTSATLSTVKSFGYGTKNVDTRYAWTFFSDTIKVNGNVVKLDNGKPLVYEPLAILPDVSGTSYEKTAGARVHKYEVDTKAYADGHLQDNDIVLFRYADVLLMKAEAQVRNGEDGSAALNAVRNRAGMPSRDATLDNILEERLLELMWEGWRRNDLIRFHRFTTAYDQRPQLEEEKDHHTMVFPIPQQSIDLNGNLKQNKGY